MILRALVLLSVFSTLVSPLPANAAEAGFRRDVTGNGVEVGIWYPTEGQPVEQRHGLYRQSVVLNTRPGEGLHPLIVMSHGTGGSFSGHADTAIALAKAGFIVAALTHPGDNWQDNSRAVEIEGRPKALSALIDYMLEQAPERAQIDKASIGAFGFSAGGFTVLAAAGARPDLTRLVGHCRSNPGFFDCRLINASPRPASERFPIETDPRLKALVVAAPALGFTFTREGLKSLKMPVQLWRADEDEILPAPFYADAVRAALPQAPEFHSVPKAGHFDFLSPCIDVKLAPQICQSRDGFDRAAFHQAFNLAIVRFFKETFN